MRVSIAKLLRRLLLIVGGVGGGISLLITAIQTTSQTRGFKAERARQIVVEYRRDFLDAKKYSIGPSCDAAAAILIELGVFPKMLDGLSAPVVDQVNQVSKSDSELLASLQGCKYRPDDPNTLTEFRAGIIATLENVESMFWLWKVNAVPADFMCARYGGDLEKNSKTAEARLFRSMIDTKFPGRRDYYRENYPGIVWAAETGGLCHSPVWRWLRELW